MRIEVRVQPGSKHELIEEVDAGRLRVKLRAKAFDGKANKALIQTLAEYYHVPKSSVHILKGYRSRSKLVEIDEEQLPI